jgi:hypothetical protein
VNHDLNTHPRNLDEDMAAATADSATASASGGG